MVPRERALRDLAIARASTVTRGYIKDVQTLVSTGPAADQFDIVITGDGFREADLAVYDARAALIAQRLLSMPPFANLAGKINIHSVRAVSRDSGVTNCPLVGGAKRTLFNVEGNFNGQYPGFMGTHTPDLIYQAGETHRAEGAARGVPGHRQLRPRRRKRVSRSGPRVRDDVGGPGQVRQHREPRAAHVIAKVGEEYIGCEPFDPATSYPNQVTEAQKQADDIWWKSLALPYELQSSAFRAVHSYGDPFDANNEPVVPAGVAGMLGLYWGCQAIDPAIPNPGGTCDPFQDPRGAPFHRAMARCRMRKSFFDFCRVCSSMLERAITSATP